MIIYKLNLKRLTADKINASSNELIIQGGTKLHYFTFHKQV